MFSYVQSITGANNRNSIKGVIMLCRELQYNELLLFSTFLTVFQSIENRYQFDQHDTQWKIYTICESLQEIYFPLSKPVIHFAAVTLDQLSKREIKRTPTRMMKNNIKIHLIDGNLLNFKFSHSIRWLNSDSKLLSHVQNSAIYWEPATFSYQIDKFQSSGAAWK